MDVTLLGVGNETIRGGGIHGDLESRGLASRIIMQQLTQSIQYKASLGKLGAFSATQQTKSQGTL